MRVEITGKIIDLSPIYTWKGRKKEFKEQEVVVDTAPNNMSRSLVSLIVVRDFEALSVYSQGDTIKCEAFLGNPRETVSSRHGGTTTFNKLTLLKVYENIHQ